MTGGTNSDTGNWGENCGDHSGIYDITQCFSYLLFGIEILAYTEIKSVHKRVYSIIITFVIP